MLLEPGFKERVLSDVPSKFGRRLPPLAFDYVLAKADGFCQLCYFPCFRELHGQENGIAPTIDHIQELRNGGTNSAENLRLTHRFCNNVREACPDPRLHRKFKRKVVQATESYLNQLLRCA